MITIINYIMMNDILMNDHHGNTHFFHFHREKELAKVTIKKEDVELIVSIKVYFHATFINVCSLT